MSFKALGDLWVLRTRFQGPIGCECAANAAFGHLKRSLNKGLTAPLFTSARINPRHLDSYS